MPIEERDLGVIVHKSLKVSSQCSKVVKEAYSILGVINRQCFNCEKSDGTREARRQRRRDERRRRDNRGAEGEGNEEWCPLPQQTRGLGSVVSSPMRGPGQSPGLKRIWCNFVAASRTLIVTI